MTAPMVADETERTELRRAARDALTVPSGPRPIEPGHAHYRPGWQRLAADYGLQGIRTPEPLGGLALGAAEEMLVHEEIGRALSDHPYLSTVGLVAAALRALPSTVDGLLQEITSGALTATAILAEEREPPVTASLDGGRATLSGRRRCVIDAQIADTLLVEAVAGPEPVLCWLDTAAPGVTVSGLSAVDLTRRFATVDLDQVAAQVLATGAPAGWAATLARNNGALAMAAESVGIAGAAFELTVDYVKTRRQFGRAIGGFQAVKHRCADLYVQLEGARSALALAVAAADSPDPTAVRTALAVARTHCGAAAFEIARETVHLHGGTGYTWEHPAHLYFRRAKSNQVLLDQHGSQRRMLAALLAQSGTRTAPTVA